MPSKHLSSCLSNICSQQFTGLPQGDSTVIILSEEGIHQGDLFGPALLSTSIHSILSDLESSFPSVRVLAYLDDVFLVGLEEDVLSSLNSLRPAFSNICLQIFTNKCEIYSPSGL